METRRDALKKLGIGSAACVVGVPAAASRPGSLPTPLEASAHPAPWDLLSPLSAGSAVGLGWSIHSLSPVEKGAAVLTLSHAGGTQARIHICAHNGSPAGVAYTELLDLVLMDGGDGRTPTDEALGRVLMGLAASMRNTEGRLSPDGLSAFRIHSDRLERFGGEGLL